MIGDESPPLADDLARFIARGQCAQAAVSFELAAAELARFEITLARLPAEYRVNFRAGTESTARTVETLDQALAAGRAMAAERAAAADNNRGPRRRRQRRPRTVKAHNRRLRMQQLARMRARLKGQSKGKED
jgi:hypothetical protein